MQSFRKQLLHLGKENEIIGLKRKELYRRESLFPHIFKSFFEDPKEKQAATKAISQFVLTAAIKQVNILHLILFYTYKPRYPSFINKHIDKWHISVSYLTMQNPADFDKYLESRLSEKLLEKAEIKTNEYLKDELRINYDASSG